MATAHIYEGYADEVYSPVSTSQADASPNRIIVLHDVDAKTLMRWNAVMNEFWEVQNAIADHVRTVRGY